MKNKKYFLAIFSRFITIFLGRVEVGIETQREEERRGGGEERDSARRSIRGQECFDFLRRREGRKKKDRFRKAVKKCEGTRVASCGKRGKGGLIG